jgi:hypothetical protein
MKKKSKEVSREATRASVKKEMAQPRMGMSARIAELNQTPTIYLPGLIRPREEGSSCELEAKSQLTKSAQKHIHKVNLLTSRSAVLKHLIRS